MKKLSAVLVLSLIALFIAGCGADSPISSTSGDTPSEPASIVVPTSLVPSSAVSSFVQSDALTADIVQQVNDVLAGYADGSLPEPVVYHSDSYEITNAPPPGVVLPASVTADQLDYDYEANEMWGGWVVTATLQLDNDFIMDVDMSVSGELGPETVEWVFGVYFQAMLGVESVEHAELPGITFTDLHADRTYASTRFDYKPAENVQLNGDLNWSKGSGLLWFSYGDQALMYTYYLQPDGSLVQDYPNEANPAQAGLDDEVMMGYSRAIIELMQQAMEENGLPV